MKKYTVVERDTHGLQLVEVPEPHAPLLRTKDKMQNFRKLETIKMDCLEIPELKTIKINIKNSTSNPNSSLEKTKETC